MRNRRGGEEGMSRPVMQKTPPPHNICSGPAERHVKWCGCFTLCNSRNSSLSKVCPGRTCMTEVAKKRLQLLLGAGLFLGPYLDQLLKALKLSSGKQSSPAMVSMQMPRKVMSQAGPSVLWKPGMPSLAKIFRANERTRIPSLGCGATRQKKLSR